MATPVEIEAMEYALHLAARGLGTVSPNPAVGCVILAPDGQRVGEGWHQRAGQDHAEVIALKAAGDKAQGATAVVTLEPCSHTGRTGPCTQALIDAGISRVVFATPDPGVASSGGADVLLQAGLAVEGEVLLDQAVRINRGWLTAQVNARPHVTVKIASSLDGRVSAPDGSMQWITNPTSRADGHRRRALVDVVMVGTGTIATDDPTLTARDVDDDLVFDQPVRVVVGHTPVPQQAKVRTGEAGFEQFTTHDVVTVLNQLWERDVRSVLIEGGPTLISAAIAAQVVDEVVMYLAPTVLGAGLASINTVLGEPLELSIDEVETLGDDIVIVGRPIKDLTGVTP